jgi:predicted nicotinamide N-methyase
LNAAPGDLEPLPEAIRFVRTHLPLRPVADVTEVRLHLATAGSGLHRLADLVGDGFRAPYWAYPWAGGVALARHLLDRPELVRGARVLDLGTGSGLVAIAACLAGAREVDAVDIDPLAIAAAALNAEANGAALSPRLGDPTAEAVPDVDIVCAGDVFYGPEVAKASLAFLDRCHEAGVRVLIGDPWRADLPTRRLRVIERYAVRDFGDGASQTEAAVFALDGPET